jgi:hypothetical protein
LLYRFDKEEKAWKTRGKGNVKLMQHKETKKIRVLLREDKTLKLRMNHTVSPEVELKPNQGSEKSWTWATTDYALDSASEETFAIKFKTEEAAREFKAKHDEARALNSGDGSAAETESKAEAAAETEAPVANAFAALKDPTRWECSQCLVENDASLSKCAACEGPNPNAPPAATEPAAAAGGFTFGSSPAGSAPTFGSPTFGAGGSAFGDGGSVFGSGSTFGATTFGDAAANPFAAAAASSPFAAAAADVAVSTPQKAEAQAAEASTPSSAKKEDVTAVEEECDAEYAPVVVLSEVETDSGEGGEDLFHQGYAVQFLRCMCPSRSTCCLSLVLCLVFCHYAPSRSAVICAVLFIFMLRRVVLCLVLLNAVFCFR